MNYGMISPDNLGFSLNPFKKHGKKRRQKIERPSVLSSPLSVGAKRQVLGFGAHTFAAGGATTATLTARPQVPFRVSRLVVQVTRTVGAAGIAVAINNVFVGTKSQFAGADSIPAEAFSFNAVGVALLGDSAQPGIDINVQFSVSAAPAGADTVIVQPVIFGDAVS